MREWSSTPFSYRFVARGVSGALIRGNRRFIAAMEGGIFACCRAGYSRSVGRAIFFGEAGDFLLVGRAILRVRAGHSP